MDTMTMAVQQLSVQMQTKAASTEYGAIRISGGKAQGGQNAQDSFSQLLEELCGNGTQVSGEDAIIQLLKKESENNSAALAAQLFALNPALAALLTQVDLQQAPVAGELIDSLQAVNILTSQTPQQAQQLLEQLLQNEQTSPVTVQPQSTQEAVKDVQNAQSKPSSTQQTALAAEVVAVTENVDKTALPQNFVAAVQKAKLSQEQSESQLVQPKVQSDESGQKTQTDSGQKQQAGNEKNSQAPSVENSQVKTEPTKTEKSKEQDITQEEISNDFAKQLSQAQQTRLEPKADKAQNVKDIMRQVTQGIEQNAKAGKEEFTIVLRPDGLGEITVKMLSENGRVTMQLSAQNQNVQRILSNELEALRSAVRPYNVEVQEMANSNSSQFSNNANQNNQGGSAQYMGFNQNGQGGFENMFSGTNQENGRYYSQFNANSDNRDSAIENGSIIIPTQSSAINTYI